MVNSKSKNEYLIDYLNNPKNFNKELKLSEIVSEVTKIYERDTGSNEIYLTRSVRAYSSIGHKKLKVTLKRVRGGIYIITPGAFKKKSSPFSNLLKSKILKRDKYTCQWCGKHQSKTTKLAVDHIEAESEGGEGIYENGITLCYKCNNIKKNLKVSSFGKKMFERYLKIAKKNNQKSAITFLEEILEVYKKHNFNS